MMEDTYVCFHHGGYDYAIEEYKVLRILAHTSLWDLPVHQDRIKGMMLVEDRLVAVIDIEQLLFQTPCSHTAYDIIIEIKG